MPRMTLQLTVAQHKAITRAAVLRQSGLFPPLAPPALKDGDTDPDATAIAEICADFYAGLTPDCVAAISARPPVSPPQPTPAEMFPTKVATIPPDAVPDIVDPVANPKRPSAK